VRPALVALAAALALPAVAAAHVTIEPPFVETGVETEIGMTVPNERPPHATVAVVVTMPTGVAIVSAAAPEGWTATVDGGTVAWTGGQITDRAEVVFPVRIEATASPGTYEIAARQRYDDGAVVRWSSDLIVLPVSGQAASEERSWPAVAAAAMVLAVVASILLLLRRQRR